MKPLGLDHKLDIKLLLSSLFVYYAHSLDSVTIDGVVYEEDFWMDQKITGFSW